MLMNRIEFLVTTSRHIKFGTAEMIKNQKVITIVLKQVLVASNIKCLTVHTLLGDGRFTSLKNGLANVGLVVNVTWRDETVLNIQRHIRTIKERTRATYATLPFKALPPRLVIKKMYASVFWLNAFLESTRISKTNMPRKCITEGDLQI